MKPFVLIVFSTIAASPLVSANLLQNPGFEEEGESWESAHHWRLDDPDDHGDAWGNAIRTDWRALEGRFAGAIRGAWSDMGEYGGFWQEATIDAGKRYRAAASFWADAGWTCELQELKIEFWNGERTELLGSEQIELGQIGESWEEREISGLAPEGAAWGRVVISVNESGNSGALQIDQVVLEEVP